jgi:hypothetical protein
MRRGADPVYMDVSIVIEQFWLLRNYILLHKYL